MKFNEQLYLVSHTNKKLYSMLREILDYDDFVYGIMDFCETDENQQKMIEIIESGVNDCSEISLWALSIAYGENINELKAKWL